MRIALLIGLLAGPVLGQDIKPLLVLEMDGPDAMRREFLPTDLGSLLGSQAAREIWPEAWDRLNQAWYGENQPDDGFWSYGGRIRVLGYVDPGPPQRDRGLIIFEPDGEPSWRRIQAEVADLLRAASGAPLRIITTSEHNWETVYLDTPGTITIPREYGDRLVSFFGDFDKMEWVIAEGLKSLEALPPAEPESHPVSLRLDLEQMAAMAQTDAGFTREQMDEVYGLPSLRDLRLRIQTSGPRILAELGVDFEGEERGLFGGLMPESRGHPELLSLVPADAGPWMIGRLRFDRLVESLGLLWAYGFGGGGGDPVAEMRAQLSGMLGFDVFDGLLNHLGDELLVVHEPDTRDPAAMPTSPLAGTCIGLRVLNEKPLRTNFPVLIELLQPMDPAARTPGDDYHGVTVHELPMEGGAHWALTPEVLLMSFGETGLDALHSVLDAQRNATGERPLPPVLARRMNAAPPGVNGMGVLDLPKLLKGGLSPMWNVFFGTGHAGALISDLDERKALERVVSLLEKHSLNSIVIFTGYVDHRFRLRLVW